MLMRVPSFSFKLRSVGTNHAKKREVRTCWHASIHTTAPLAMQARTSILWSVFLVSIQSQQRCLLRYLFPSGRSPRRNSQTWSLSCACLGAFRALFALGVGGASEQGRGRARLIEAAKEEDDQPPARVFVRRVKEGSQGRKARAAREMLDCRPSLRGMERPE